jgi:hypothetical protein
MPAESVAGSIGSRDCRTATCEDMTILALAPIAARTERVPP